MFVSADAPLQQGIQEEILHPAPHQESRRHQQHIPLPIHPPLIINLGDEEDDEDDEEENCKQGFSFFYKDVEWGFLTLHS